MAIERAASATSALSQASTAMIEQFHARLPALAFAALILIVGWLLAFVVRALARRLSQAANRLLDRLFQRRAQAGLSSSFGAMALLAELAFWLTLITAVALAAQVAGFAAVATWLNDLVAYLPNLIAGAAIILAGVVISAIVGEQVTASAQRSGARQSLLIGRFVQIATLTTAAIIGLGQIGIDVTLLIALAVVVTGAILIGFALAFGLGARDFLADVIAARALSRQVRPGMNVQIGSYQGEVLELSSTRIAIDTHEGKALLPARMAAAETIVVLDALAAAEQPHDE